MTIMHDAPTSVSHPTWCQDPCHADDRLAGDRKHFAEVASVSMSSMSMGNRLPLDDRLPQLHVYLSQHVRDIEPTLALAVEDTSNRSGYREHDVRLTVAEAEELRDVLTQAIARAKAGQR